MWTYHTHSQWVTAAVDPCLLFLPWGINTRRQIQKLPCIGVAVAEAFTGRLEHRHGRKVTSLHEPLFQFQEQKRSSMQCSSNQQCNLQFMNTLWFLVCSSLQPRNTFLWINLLLVRFIWHSWRALSKCVLSAALENAIVQQIKLHSSSFPIDNELNVVSFNNLVIPAKISRTVMFLSVRQDKHMKALQNLTADQLNLASNF